MKKPETKEREYCKVTEFSIQRVTQYKDTIYCDLKINGIFINGCRVVEGKDGDFIAFPSYKGKDDKYHNYVYVSLSKEDSKAILDEVEKELNK